jgi:uncharacterized protein (DUF427 family)
MRNAGAAREITIVPNPRRVRVIYAGCVIADSTHALTLYEAGLRPVQYIPREDADLSLLRRTRHATYCPHKGDAAYFSIEVAGKTSVDAVWTYEQPYPGVAAIAGYLAFYPQRVDAIEESDNA